MLHRVAISIRAIISKAERHVSRALRPQPSLIGGLTLDLIRSRSELIAENAFLRQQLVVAARSAKRPRFRHHERFLTVLLSAMLPRWKSAVMLVKPETVLRWHREGFRIFWRRQSHSVRTEPRTPAEVRKLIARMAVENPLWARSAFVVSF